MKPDRGVVNTVCVAVVVVLGLAFYAYGWPW